MFKAERKERAVLEIFEMLEDAKRYFVEVKKFLDDHGAKTWKKTLMLLSALTGDCSLHVHYHLLGKSTTSSKFNPYPGERLLKSKFYSYLFSLHRSFEVCA